MYQGSAFRQGLHHFLLMLCGFCHNCVILRLRRRQMQLIGIGVFVCCVPLIILYCFTQKTFVQSLVMTGSKE